MDPTETLHLFREAVGNFRQAQADEDVDAIEACAGEVINYAEDLFEWLAKGGYAPDWQGPTVACIHCGKAVDVSPEGDVTSDGLPDCWEAPRRECQFCGSNGEDDPGCSECSDTDNSWMGVHAVSNDEDGA